jgi:hypothetical protein
MDQKLRLILGLVAIFLFLIGSGTLAMLILLAIAGEWLFAIYVSSSERIGPKPKLNEPKE